MLSFIIWDVAPNLFNIGNFQLHWYSLFFAAGFYFGYKILTNIYKGEGKDESHVDTLTVYMFLATLLGARIGHCVFYDWAYFSQHPLEILLPFQFEPEFEFTGFRGLASHGAAFGILIAIFLYTRKYKEFSFLYVLDRLVIVIALAGACIRMGNFMNSEIIGKNTTSPMGIVFAHPVEDYLKTKFPNQIKSVDFIKTGKDTVIAGKNVVELKMKMHIVGIDSVDAFTQYAVMNALYEWAEYGVYTFSPLANLPIVDKKTLRPKDYEITTIQYGIPRHPAQLYEALSSFVLFVVLFIIYKKHKEKLPEGRLVGLFIVILFSLRFAYEYLKENQVAFEDNMTLNMGQWLSVPLIVFGVYVLLKSFRKQGEIS